MSSAAPNGCKNDVSWWPKGCRINDLSKPALTDHNSEWEGYKAVNSSDDEIWLSFTPVFQV